VKSVNIHGNTPVTVISFSQKPSTIQIYGQGFSGYVTPTNISFDLLKEKGYLSLSMSSVNDTGVLTESFILTYRVAYVSDTSISIDVYHAGFTVPAGYNDRSTNVNAKYRISTVVAQYKTTKTVVKVDPDLVPVEDKRDLIINFGTPKGAYQAANFVAPLPAGVTWDHIKSKYESLEVYIVSSTNWGYRSTSKKIDNVEIGMPLVYHTLDGTYHNSTDYNIIVAFSAAGLQANGSNNRVRSVRVYGIKKAMTVNNPALAKLPPGYEMQVLEGTYASSKAQTINFTVPYGKKLLRTPTVETLDRTTTAHMVGRGYRNTNDWVFSVFTTSTSSILLESVQSYLYGKRYKMVLEFVDL